MSPSSDSGYRRVGYMCECGALTTNLTQQCDDCADRAFEDYNFELEMAQENAAFDRRERLKFWLGSGTMALGFILLFYAIWSLT